MLESSLVALLFLGQIFRFFRRRNVDCFLGLLDRAACFPKAQHREVRGAFSGCRKCIFHDENSFAFDVSFLCIPLFKTEAFPKCFPKVISILSYSLK